jgi:hypothetical protein
MSAETPPSTVNTSSIFDDNTMSSSPRELSQRTIIIIASVIGAALILLVTVGIIHYNRLRRYRQAQETLQQDIERSLRRARPPVLAVDTELPRANELSRSRSRATVPVSTQQQCKDLPPVPMVQVRNAPPVTYGALEGFARGASRNSQGSHSPGLGGRSLSRPTRQEQVEAVGPKKPVKMYNSQTIRVI